MHRNRLFAVTVVTFGIAAVVHAAFTWPIYATLAFFGSGTLIAFIAEAAVIKFGWLEHHISPKVSGVPLYVLFGWTGTIYIALRLALIAADGWAAIVTAGLLATGYDVLTDHRGVTKGHWTYTDDLSGPRYRGVPWWNFAGWFAISSLTSAITIPFV